MCCSPAWRWPAVSPRRPTSTSRARTSTRSTSPRRATRLLAVNTPDALLEVFTVERRRQLCRPSGDPRRARARDRRRAHRRRGLGRQQPLGHGQHRRSRPRARPCARLRVGDEPTDVAFAGGKAFVAVSQEDAVKVYDLANLNAAPTVVPLFGRDVRALAVSADGHEGLRGGAALGEPDDGRQRQRRLPATSARTSTRTRLAALGLRDMSCAGARRRPIRRCPAGIARNPALIDPPERQFRPVGLIVRWDERAGQWRDEAGQDWTHCLPYRLPDHDLFVIDAATLAVDAPSTTSGTTLFDVSVNPANGRIYVPQHRSAELRALRARAGRARPRGGQPLAVVDPAARQRASRCVDLNAHIDRASDPATNLAERLASISQPGMMVWQSDGSVGLPDRDRLAQAVPRRRRLPRRQLHLRSEPRGARGGRGRRGPDRRRAARGHARPRLYVLNRISHSIAIVDACRRSQLGEVAAARSRARRPRGVGRRFLYDAHRHARGTATRPARAATSPATWTAWPGTSATRAATSRPTPRRNDNVRFIVPSGRPAASPARPACAPRTTGFDPQKGPMTTQTLRGMLEPLHWRGDRATMNDFNPAFVGPDGRGTTSARSTGKPAGLSRRGHGDVPPVRPRDALPAEPVPQRRRHDALRPRAQSIRPARSVARQPVPRQPDRGGRALRQRSRPTPASPAPPATRIPSAPAGGTLGGVTPARADVAATRRRCSTATPTARRTAT